MSLSVLLVSLFTFVQFNCENLFDCQHDSLKNDVEFLPDGSYHWTPFRYWRKLNDTYSRSRVGDISRRVRLRRIKVPAIVQSFCSSAFFTLPAFRISAFASS